MGGEESPYGGAHGDSLLILVSLEALSKKPPPLADIRSGGGSTSQRFGHKKPRGLIEFRFFLFPLLWLSYGVFVSLLCASTLSLRFGTLSAELNVCAVLSGK